MRRHLPLSNLPPPPDWTTFCPYLSRLPNLSSPTHSLLSSIHLSPPHASPHPGRKFWYYLSTEEVTSHALPTIVPSLSYPLVASCLRDMSKINSSTTSTQTTFFILTSQASVWVTPPNRSFFIVLTHGTRLLTRSNMLVYSSLMFQKHLMQSVNHPLLISKLHSLGVDDPGIAWFQFYLSHCLQVTNTAELLSSSKCTTSSVPQGSVLGPTHCLVLLMTSHQSFLQAALSSLQMILPSSSSPATVASLNSPSNPVLTEAIPG